MSNVLFQQSSACYRELDRSRKEIRVLRLLDATIPGYFGNKTQLAAFDYIYLDEIDAENETTTENSYYAISWCWGEISYTASISVDGCYVNIPRNALEVIESLCLPQRKLRIWIDAICINQKDLDERAHQVSMMDKVYCHARKVLVWLGRERSHMQSAITSLQTILQQCRESSVDLKPIPFTVRSDVPLPENIDWPAVMDFFSVSWFERLWCLQEVTLARHAICFRGEHQITWDGLLMVARWMDYLAYDTYPGSKTSRIVTTLASLHVRSLHASDLTYLLSLVQISGWRTTDPRDHIYAILGLANYQNLDLPIRNLLTPNYRHSLARIYADATRAAIMQRNKLWLLDYCHRRAPTSDQDADLAGFPSRVPEYHFGGHSKCSSRIIAMYWGNEELQEGIVDHETAWDTLRTSGIILDEIGHVTEPMERTDNAGKTAAFLAGFWTIVLRQLLAHSSTPKLAERFRRMLFTPRNAERPNVTEARRSGKAQHIAEFRAFVKDCWPPSAESPPVELRAHDGPVEIDHRKTARAITDACHGRELFIAKSGRLGMAHPNAQVSDKICRLPTVPSPLVLRQKGEQWLLIGNTYLEDAMDRGIAETLGRFGKRMEDFQWLEIV